MAADYWISDRLGSPGWAKKAWQVWLSQLIRDVQYAIDQGDGARAELRGLQKRACAIGRRRDTLAESTLEAYDADLNRRLERLLSLTKQLGYQVALRRAAHPR